LAAVVRPNNTQQGGAGLRLVVLLLVLAVGGYLAWGFINQSSGPHVTTSNATTASAQQKAESFVQAQQQAQRTGRAVKVVQTFSDAELSSLANEAAEARAMPVSGISLHSTDRGTVQGTATARVAGQTVPVTLEGVPVVTDNRVALDVTSTKVGSIPLPGPISDQVTQSLKQPLELGQPIQGFQQLQVSVTSGQLTVSGVASPS
jgi:uncharacterized protein YpmS